MLLDGRTVLFDTTLLAITVGGLLLFTGTRKAGDQSLRFWGLGYWLAALATVLFSARGIWPDIWSIDISNAALALSYGLQWGGARRFVRRDANVAVIFGGPAIWLVACQVEAFHASVAARILLSSTIVGFYLFSIAWSFARLGERLPSRIPLAILMALHGLVYVIRIPLAFLVPPSSGANVIVTPWFVAVTVEALFHLVASSTLLVSLAKERAESRVQKLAETDSLTGLSNRRAFLDFASHSLDVCRATGRPSAILMIDIDHFKQINDTLGHHGGDDVLQRVAETMRKSLRPTDPLGRIGGEEFACFLANCDHAQAMQVAERLRASVFDSGQTGVSVSVGVAATDAAQPAFTLDAFMSAADRALYESKHHGRNRVTIAQAA